MIRLLLLLALAATPLIAAAHGGHHAPPPRAAVEQQPTLAIASASSVSAPSRCPGGDHENCCCHEPWCTSSAGSIVIADAAGRELQIIAPSLGNPACETLALPSAALSRHAPRGPPLLS